MVKHYIVMSSAYSIGKRIVIDYHYDNVKEMSKIKEDIDYIIKMCGKDVPISTHSIQTSSASWESVIKADKFFRGTLKIETKEEFVEIILKNSILTGLDIAKYILSVVPSTHLKLEKLTYLCYADYLCQEGEKLFQDRIFAYKLGPIIESVYKKYKKSGLGKLQVEDNKKTYNEDLKKLSSRSRILSSKDGFKKLSSIDNTLKKYSHLSARDLVDLTHRNETPWEKSDALKNLNIEISDELIMKYHVNELL